MLHTSTDTAHTWCLCNENNCSLFRRCTSVTATAQPLLYYMTLMCAVVCIRQAREKGENRPPAVWWAYWCTLLVSGWCKFDTYLLFSARCNIYISRYARPSCWHTCDIMSRVRMVHETRISAIAEGPCDALVSTNLATAKHPILKWLQSTNDLEVYMPKVIVIAAFT